MFYLSQSQYECYKVTIGNSLILNQDIQKDEYVESERWFKQFVMRTAFTISRLEFVHVGIIGSNTVLLELIPKTCSSTLDYNVTRLSLQQPFEMSKKCLQKFELLCTRIGVAEFKSKLHHTTVHCIHWTVTEPSCFILMRLLSMFRRTGLQLWHFE